MSMAFILQLMINISMGIVVLGLGLDTSRDQLTYLLRRPDLIGKTLLSMSIVMPVVALLLVMPFDLEPAVKIGIVALALSPLPPVLPATLARAGGRGHHIYSLLIVAALLSLIVVPVGLFVLQQFFNLGTMVPAGSVAFVLAITIVIPLVVGVAVHQLAPALANRAAKRVALAGYVLLLVSLVPVLVMEFGSLIDILGNGTLLALALFTAIGLLVGHLLGGPNPDERSVLALATGSRHPGVALAIATLAFPQTTAVLTVVLWHLIMAALVSLPYVKWRRSVHDLQEQTGPSAGG